MTGVIVGTVLMIALFLFGVPVMVSIAFGTVLILLINESMHLMTNLGQAQFEGLNAFAFLAIPLYILTGDIIYRTGVATALFDFARSIFGAVKGGLSATVLLACGFFAAISGSNASDAAIFTRLTVPELARFGYPRAYSGALVAAGGSTAILIPPSVGYILLGYVTRISVGDLFLATILPGILVVAVMIMVNFVYVWRMGYQADTGTAAFSFSEVARSAWRAKVGFSFPVIILGGIYAGIFTPSEAGAVACGVGLAYGFATRKMGLGELAEALKSSGLVCGTIMPIMAMAYFFGQTMTYFEIQKDLVGWATSLTENQALILLTMFLVLFVMGTFIDFVPNVVILAPLMMPVAEEIGMDPVHFGIWFMFTLGIGFITPPYGFNLFVVSSVSGESVPAIGRRIMPFLIAMLITNFIIAAFPALSLWILGR